MLGFGSMALGWCLLCSWVFPASSLPCSADQALGWSSAFKPPPPPPPPILPPADWAGRIASGDMVFTGLPPSLIGEGFFPIVGNGFLALEMGPFTQPFLNTWPWRDAGAMKLNGVYNGRNYSSPSHRAQLPRLSDCALVPVRGASFTALGSALDFSTATYYNRTRVQNLSGCADGTVIEMRTYAHRSLRELFVHEVSAFSESGDPQWSGCTLPVAWAPSPASPDASLAASAPGTGEATIYSGATLLGEEEGLPTRAVAMVFPTWVAAAPTSLSFSPSAPRHSLLAVLRSDLDVGLGASPAQVAAAALATWQDYSQHSSDALFALHCASLAQVYGSGVELAGNASLAAVVNASIHDIVLSLRADWNWSTSPGGLATGGEFSQTLRDGRLPVGRGRAHSSALLTLGPTHPHARARAHTHTAK